jgi:hypothetical protein
MAWDERTKCLATCSAGEIRVNCRCCSLKWACLYELVVFFVDLVNGQRPNHSRHTEERRNLFQIGLASKQGTNGRRGSGRGQEIGRQFHFGWVSLSTE